MTLAADYGLRVEFYSHVYGLQRDALIEQSKIVLNIANEPWAEVLGNFLQNKGDLKRNTLNEHRIRYLLSMGKVVVSERSGVMKEEKTYEGILAFTDTNGLFWRCLGVYSINIYVSMSHPVLQIIATHIHIIMYATFLL